MLPSGSSARSMAWIVARKSSRTARVCRSRKETAMPKRLGLSLVLLLGLVATAQAQLPVIDAGNLVQNTTTAIESVLTTIETVLIEANQVLELTPLDEIAVAGGMAEDMQLLGQLVQEAEGLSYDLGSLRAQIDALFNLNTTPKTTNTLQKHLNTIHHIHF